MHQKPPGIALPPVPSRRDFLSTSALAAAYFSESLRAAAVDPVQQRSGAVSIQNRPVITDGVACGDVRNGKAVIWSRADREAKMIVEYSTRESMKDARKVTGSVALAHSDFTSKAVLQGLPADQQIFYRVSYQDLSEPGVMSQPVVGRFHTPPSTKRDLHFVWSGDTAGQGFGINPEFGGMRLYSEMLSHDPHFFINSGDVIYADHPIEPEVRLDNGTIWKNVVTDAKSKVAETIDEFRGNYRYNLLDENIRRFNAGVAQYVQWDDHEVLNNWYPGGRTEDPRYTVKSHDLLAARAHRAFQEYTPTLWNPEEPQRTYQSFRYGPQLEIFRIDLRSYRGMNSTNMQAERSEDTALLGASQLEWLQQALRRSTATWKIISSDLPVGLVIPDGKKHFEGAANGSRELAGRELEIAQLLSSIKKNNISNVVWLTADVHYAAAHYYDPARAAHTDFLPFWEFVAGPLHAGTFGPNELDSTFGPTVKFSSVPEDMKANRPPSEGMQYFGKVALDSATATLTVSFHAVGGRKIYSVDLLPAKRQSD